MSNEIRELYASLEKSYSQIANINQPIENPRLYAKADRGGNVTFIAQLFASWSGKEVTHGVTLVCSENGLDNLGMHSGVVVAGEAAGSLHGSTI